MSVEAERLVIEADVVGPREELRVGSLHVVALVERVDGYLPIGREHRRQRRADAEPVEVVGSQQGRQRVEVLEQRWRARIEADPDEAPPTVDLDRLEAGLRRDRVELVPVDYLDQAPVQVVAPGVVAAPDAAVGEAAGPIGETRAAVQTRVVKGPDGVGVRPDDEDRLVADEVFGEGPDLGDLVLPARDLPDTRPEPVELQLGEVRTGVALTRDGAVLADQDLLEIHVAVHHRCAQSSVVPSSFAPPC